MKYFTAALYQQFNSFDVDEAERADETWDKAEAAYKERLARIREHMPSQVVKLSELCLPMPWSSLAWSKRSPREHST